MWRSLGHFFQTVGHLFIGVERSAQAAQPVIDAIARALGPNTVGFLAIEHLAVSILGDVIDAVKAAETKGGDVATLAAETVGGVKQLIGILEAHPEAPKPAK